jgi:6-phosphogluconolactonase (cycloisomerase 2 family)
MKIKEKFIILSMLLALAPMMALGDDRPANGAVYVMSNSPEGNQVIVFDRNSQGKLTLANSYATGGLGSGGGIDPLASQGSLILSPNKRWLFAVNAASNDITVFRVRRHGLARVGTFGSGGSFPVSLTLYHNLLYVLNSDAGGSGANIAGLTINRHGQLKALAGSTRLLGPGGFHQVGFNPHGDALVVTQGDPAGDNEILVFSVDEDGLPDAEPVITPSAGIVPFGFIFDWRGHLLVSEAGSGAVSSYALRRDKTLRVISASLSNGNSATCWIAGTWHGTVFTSNTGSDNISSYKVRATNGQLRLLEANAASGNKPIDMASAGDGRYLYVLNAGDGSVGGFRILSSGNLKDLGAVAGLPLLFAQGLAVR